MPVLHTSSGDITVNNWGYMLQGAGGSTLDPAVLAQSGYDLIVTDFSRDGWVQTILIGRNRARFGIGIAIGRMRFSMPPERVGWIR